MGEHQNFSHSEESLLTMFDPPNTFSKPFGFFSELQSLHFTRWHIVLNTNSVPANTKHKVEKSVEREFAFYPVSLTHISNPASPILLSPILRSPISQSPILLSPVSQSLTSTTIHTQLFLHPLPYTHNYFYFHYYFCINYFFYIHYFYIISNTK